MPATFAQVNEVNPGESISAAIFNELLRAHNSLVSVSGSVIGSLQPGNLRLNFKRNTDLVRDIALIGLVQAEVDSETPVSLKAFKPAGIVEAVFDPNVPEASRRITVCKPAASEHFGKWVIPIQDIDPGFLGPAIIEGLALVKFKRLFDKMVLNRVDIWGAEDVLVENIIGLGEWIHDEGKAIGVEQFALIRMSARTDDVLRVSSTLAVTVGQPVMMASGGLVGDGIPSVEKPDADFIGHAIIIVGKNITAGETGFATTGMCVAQVDEAGDPEDNFGGEDDKTTLIKDEQGFKSLGTLGATGGSTFNIVRPFFPNLIRTFVDAVNLIKSNDVNTVFQANGNIARVISTGVSHDVLFHFKKPLRSIDLFRYIESSNILMRWLVNGGAGEKLGNVQLDIVTKLILTDWDETTVTFNIASGFEERNTREQRAFLSGSALAELSNNVTFSLFSENPQLGNAGACVDYGLDGFSVSAADLALGRRIRGVRMSLEPKVLTGAGAGGETADGVLSNAGVPGSENHWAIS